MGYAAESSDAEEVVNLAQNSVYHLSDGHVRQDYQSIGESVRSTSTISKKSKREPSLLAFLQASAILIT